MKTEDTLKTQWNQLHGKLRQHWHALTDEDMKRIAGHRDVLVELLQERYAVSRETAEQEVTDLVDALTSTVHSNRN